MISFDLFLLRHGPPLRSGLMLGHCDEPAADGAHDRLVARARYLAADRVIASDLHRAAEGGRAIARDRDLPLQLDPRWRELDFGAWDGCDPALLPEAALQRFWADPDRNPPPGGESWGALRKRVRAAILALSGPAIVVSHAGAIRAAVSLLTGLDHRGVWAFDLPYGASLTMRVWQDGGLTGQITGLAQ
ncbi:histidine phosphatase family protein [Croceicoccus mobilis]|uniref:Fructose 2,6-bisphosphatase n=1 Tax=Croceicoccus mobilis TaxID=1703339 RepID=A0A916Z9I2_9SPHN|nr:histidine phosphatase family protein [Croceicoccus mobilis]GGD81515.1 fructose 2,6-bisphosphatase [Croceicoccus mobilis]